MFRYLRENYIEEGYKIKKKEILSRDLKIFLPSR